jgi:hypothetical protein
MKSIERFILAAVIVGSATALPGCIVAVPLVINYFSSSSEYIATAEVAHPADNVYAAVVRELEGPELNVTITKRDDAERLLEINDGVQTATVKVIREDRGETQIIVTASKGTSKRQKELALQVLLHLCRQYGEECTVRE